MITPAAPALIALAAAASGLQLASDSSSRTSMNEPGTADLVAAQALPTAMLSWKPWSCDGHPLNV